MIEILLEGTAEVVFHRHGVDLPLDKGRPPCISCIVWSHSGSEIDRNSDDRGLSHRSVVDHLIWACHVEHFFSFAE